MFYRRCLRLRYSYADPLDGDAAGGVVHPVNVDMDRVFRGQQVGEVFAPLSGHNGTLIQIIVKPAAHRSFSVEIR